MIRTEKEKKEIAIKWLENALCNIDNIKVIGQSIIPTIKNQINNAIKYLNDEELEEDVWGK